MHQRRSSFSYIKCNSQVCHKCLRKNIQRGMKVRNLYSKSYDAEKCTKLKSFIRLDQSNTNTFFPKIFFFLKCEAVEPFFTWHEWEPRMKYDCLRDKAVVASQSINIFKCSIWKKYFFLSVLFQLRLFFYCMKKPTEKKWILSFNRLFFFCFLFNSSIRTNFFHSLGSIDLLWGERGEGRTIYRCTNTHKDFAKS